MDTLTFHPMEYKMILTYKQDAKNQITCYKACLVAKGFIQ